MPKSTRFIEHINSLVSTARSNLARNTAAHEELETALKHIHPDYSVSISRPNAVRMEDAWFNIGLKEEPIPFNVQVVRNNEIHISEADLALLMDLPFMKVDSPTFNIKLDKWLKIRLRDKIVNDHRLATIVGDVDKIRAEWIEQFALLHSNPKQLFEQLKMPNETFDTVIEAYVSSFELDVMQLIDQTTDQLHRFKSRNTLGGRSSSRGDLTCLEWDLSRSPMFYGAEKGVSCIVDDDAESARRPTWPFEGGKLTLSGPMVTQRGTITNNGGVLIANYPITPAGVNGIINRNN